MCPTAPPLFCRIRIYTIAITVVCGIYLSEHASAALALVLFLPCLLGENFELAQKLLLPVALPYLLRREVRRRATFKGRDVQHRWRGR